VGAPIDTKAAPSLLSTLAGATAPAAFEELVQLGNGLLPGRKVLKLWGPESAESENIGRLLQTEETASSPALASLEWRGYSRLRNGSRCGERLHASGAISRVAPRPSWRHICSIVLFSCRTWTPVTLARDPEQATAAAKPYLVRGDDRLTRVAMRSQEARLRPFMSDIGPKADITLWVLHYGIDVSIRCAAP
jgi:hypothetical protein